MSIKNMDIFSIIFLLFSLSWMSDIGMIIKTMLTMEEIIIMMKGSLGAMVYVHPPIKPEEEMHSKTRTCRIENMIEMGAILSNKKTFLRK